MNQLTTLLNSVMFLLVGIGIFVVLIKLAGLIEQIENLMNIKSNLRCFTQDGISCTNDNALAEKEKRAEEETCD